MRYLFLLLLLLGFLVNCSDSTNPDKPDGAKDKTEETGKENSVAMNTRSSENNEISSSNTKPTSRPDIDKLMAKYDFYPLRDLSLYQKANFIGTCMFGPGYGNKNKFQQILINAKCAM